MAGSRNSILDFRFEIYIGALFASLFSVCPWELSSYKSRFVRKYLPSIKGDLKVIKQFEDVPQMGKTSHNFPLG